MDNRCRLRPASLTDLDALVALEKASFSDPWTSSELGEALRWPEAVVLIAEADDGARLGYVLGRVVVDEGEVLSIAIVPARRREGFGRQLLQALLIEMRRRGAHAAWLEVRASNAGAQALYAAEGFVPAGLRRGYYRRPPEDALVYRLDLETLASSWSGAQ